MATTRTTSATAALLLLWPLSMYSQRIVIPSTVSCSSCAFVVENVATIHGVGMEGPASTMQRAPGGEFYLINDRLLKAFRPDGRLLRQVGRRGAGPGEYEIIRNTLVAPDGYIHIIDAQLARHSVFSKDGRFSGSTTLSTVAGGLGLDAALWRDGGLIANVRPQSRTGSPLHFVDRQGRATELPDTLTNPAKRWLHQRLLAVRRNGELVVARPYAITLDVYSSTLAKRAVIAFAGKSDKVREPNDEPSDGMFDEPYTPAIRGLWEDTDGLVWVLSVWPHPKWTPTARPPRDRSTDPEAMQALAKRTRVEIVLEVLDLKAERLVARRVTADYFGLPFGAGYFATSVEDSTGESSLQISRIRLKR